MAETSKGKLVIVEWEVSGKEVDEKRLKTFIKAKSDTEPIVSLGKYRRIALLEFKEENDVNFLRNQWKSGDFWTVTNISVVSETKMVKVTNLPKNASRRDINHYFTNENMVNLKLDVDVMEKYFHPEKGFCVLNLSSASDVKRVCKECKKFKEFRKCQLALEPYYAELEALTELITGKVEEIKPITVDNIDNAKMKYMKDFCKQSIEQQFKSVCANIFWAREGRNKVGLKFDCEHNDLRQEHGIAWEKNVRQLLQNILDDIVVVRKNLSSGVWDKVQEVLISFPLDSVLIDEEADEHRLTVVGHIKNSAIAKIENDLDAIQPPKPIVKKDVKVSNKIKLAAFADLQMGDTVGGVTVDCQINDGLIRIHGDKETISKAEIEILEILNQIVVESTNFSSREAANILITPLMRDKIESCKDDLGERCGYLIEKDTLNVFSTGQANLEKFEKKIKALIIEEDKTLQGKVEHESNFKVKIKEIEDIYSPYVKLASKISKENVVIHIVCGKDYYGPVCDDLNENVETLLITNEEIRISPHIVKYIQKKSIENIHKSIKQIGLSKDVFESDVGKTALRAKGNASVRQRVVGIVQTEAKKIQVSWRQIEEEGIHDYFADGYKFLLDEIQKHQCEFRIATQYEMKNEDMHCIVTLETGQALFVGAGTLENPKLPVDVIVNAANAKLEHKGGLAAVLVKAGGKSVQDDCIDYINKNGELQPGDIYVGSAGKLPCQRIIHAVGPEWKGGNSNEDEILQTVVENILEAMNRDKEFILRSLALPLISAGVFGYPRSRSAKIILDTMKNKLKSTPNVREIYFYDPNPDIVRTIQKQMQCVFGDKCFHLPVRNIAVGKGTMTKFAASKHFNLQRTGTRTLPLPGGTKIIIKWGDLQTTAADILVNATPTAPTPSGKISDGLKYAAGVGFAMESECNKAFKKVYPGGNVPDGMLVQTKAGRIPCSEIYHLKIDNNKSSGCKSLAGYIITCLKEAVRQKRTSIAFPTIGTADCDYPGDKVALTFIRTIGEFMQLHITCSLTEITIVIYKTDIITTSAFEVILEQLYSKRPHRLLADIEETMETKDGEEEEVKVKPKQRQPSPKRPRSAVHRNRVQKQNEGSFALDGTNGAAVDLEVGGIESSKADVIVCTTSSFPKLNGAISAAVMKAGGPDIQKECNRCYKSYPDQGVAVTKAGNLRCKKVFYTVLKDYTPANAKNVSDYVLKCLEQAEKDHFTSIAMPTFGTGGFKYPDQVSASQMFTAIKEFFKKKRSYLKLIVVVMYGPAQQTCQTFYQEAVKAFTQMKAPTTTAVIADTAPVQNVGDLLWSVPKSSTSLEISYGNLELAKADVILDTTISFPNLNGIIPESLSKRAGPQLKEECKRFKGNVSSGMIIETKGYNLDCKQVYHYFMPDWKESDGEQTISNCIDDCLQKMKQSGLRSIAIPSIGTGGARYNPRKVARGIYRAVADFGAANGDVNCHVNLVLFPAARDINKTFTEELQAFMSGKTNEQKPPAKGVRFAEDGYDKDRVHVDDDIVISTKRRDFLLIQFTSDDRKTVDLAFKSIKAKVESETRDVTIDLTKDGNIDDLDLVTANKGKNKKTIEDIGEDYHVKVIVDTKTRKVKVRGLGDGVIKCYKRILRFLQEKHKEAVSKDIGKIVYQYIEWYYTEDGGKIWVPYPRHIRYLLEDANFTKATEKEFRDSNEKLYVVDFTKMEEYVKEKREKETTVSVIRKDLTEGALKALPHTWQAMGELENLKEVVLSSTDREYKDVVANFRVTVGNYRLSQIKEIRRIQNRTLYQQYQTKKEQLKSEHKNVPHLQVERTLWHGTQEDKEKSITSNGFNRSYAGATFQGMLWYGMGVYFAVNSEYSTQQFYSPPDKNGWKRMYQVKVLTGLTTWVPQGYMERFAPEVPGSATDRYNSTCDDDQYPTEFVIYNDTQAYPEYIILFK
ncbi:protein mono-ADP-ribosyltransferase PARP14-like [Mercenaria mercenaria]|uniref:protein mono-ADP-ribosyltransferase PARP14-like n=1 Tax=Mercenaria mercenaria TaxID=6596 RepID=UPI00234EA06A|nr:protein mono-ADP-ribosyltransferase PARP14-like [Mercenaria mercenaria]